jgi:hypothetical protein
MNPERVVPGQVVSADDDSDEPARPQETFLHKVASGPAGPVGTYTASTDPASTDTASTDTASAGTAGRHARTNGTGWDADPDTDDDTEVIAAADAGDSPRSGPADATDASLDDTDLDDTSVDDTSLDDTDLDDLDTAATRTADPDTDPVNPDAVAVADVTEADTDTDTDTVPDTNTDTDTVAADTQTDLPAVPVPASPAPAGATPDSDEPLLGEAAGLIREEWRQVQGSFVDDPRASVTAAAGVVADAAARLESLLRERQRSLRGSLDGNGQADTETLRQLMLTYRRLLNKLIS